MITIYRYMYLYRCGGYVEATILGAPSPPVWDRETSLSRKKEVEKMPFVTEAWNAITTFIATVVVFVQHLVH